MLPPVPQQSGAIEASKAVSSDNLNSPNHQEPCSNSDQWQESPTESASSQETWPTATALLAKKRVFKEEAETDLAEHSITLRTTGCANTSLRDIARERVDVIAERIRHLPDEYLEELKGQLRVILEGNGGPHQREEFLDLQRIVQTRSDLTVEALSIAHPAQLEILVAIKTGIQAFLHPSINLSQSSLIEVFNYKRCRNIACRNQLPAEDCPCEVCSTRKGFCNLCMCVICYKFDFEVNTFRWIGCDLCSHWTHTDCAIRNDHIYMGVSGTRIGLKEMLFRCKACNRTSELLGWVKDVFQNCAVSWNADALARELNFVCRVFRASEDLNGRKLFWKCEDLIDKLKNGFSESMACKSILLFFQELDLESFKNIKTEEIGWMFAPQEACNRIAAVVHEAVGKMEMVAEMKTRMFKKARLALDVCDRELADKAREVADLKMERQKKKLQIEELESLVRLKQAEADMFQLKANEAKREAESLQKIIFNKSERCSENYASFYLKLRLEEAEAERQFLLSKIKLQESSQASATRK